MRIPREVPTALGREFIALAPDIAAAILLTLKAGWAYASAFPEVNTGAREVAITERLREGMRAALKCNTYPWSKTMIVAPGTESRSAADVLVPDGRTDIPIYFIEICLRLGEHDPHAIIECKRIDGSDTDLCREYVIEGIDRFRTGKYAENHTTGFMTGYILSGDCVAAVSGINAFLRRQSRHADRLAASGVLREKWTYGSRHSREPRRTPITLYHAFFRLSSTHC